MEKLSHQTPLDKIAKGLAIYGTGLLGLGVIVNSLFKAFSINFHLPSTVFGLFIFGFC